MTDVDSRLPDEHEAVFDDLRAVLLQPPAEHVAEQHLAAMVQELPARPAVVALVPRRARRALAAATVGAAVLIAGGIAAASGSLPGPLQDTVARVLEPFGVDLPGAGTDSRPAQDAPSESDDPLDSDGQSPLTTTDAAGQPVPETGDQPASGASDGADNGVNDPTTPANNPTSPGQSGSAPGQQDQPGNSQNAPGQTGETPGRSETAPGQSDNQNNKPETPPGQAK
jgi:hypothetical protein